MAGVNQKSTYTSPKHGAVTKSDDTQLEAVRALYIGVGGDVVVVDQYGVSATYKNAQSGSTLLIQAKKVMDATTATDIVALY